MRVVLAFVLLIFLGAGAFWMMRGSAERISLADAAILSVKDEVQLHLKVENLGPPDEVMGVDVQGFETVLSSSVARLVVPAGAAASFSSDGVYVILKGGPPFNEGDLIPFSVDFGAEGVISARAKVGVASPHVGHVMRHVLPDGVTPPSLALKVTLEQGALDVQLLTENFEFAGPERDMMPSVGEGHAHIYLNGLKLGRLYDAEVKIGALLPGQYQLRVALNTNDHRAYVADGNLVENIFEFTVK